VRVLLAAAPHRDTFGYSMPPPGLLRLGGELVRRGIPVEIEDLALRLSAGEIASGDRMSSDAAELLLARASRPPSSVREARTSSARDTRKDAAREVRGSAAQQARTSPADARDDEPLVIGLSVMGATLPIALLILERLRERMPRTQLWLGGPGTTGVDEILLARFPFVDAVVRGEGEVTVPELCAAIGAGEPPRGVRGVTWRGEDGRVHREADREPMNDLSNLAPYAWELLPPLAAYKRITGASDGLVPIDSGRGCAYDCSFCTIGRFWNRRSRTLPAKRLADEVESLRAMPAAKSAYLCHDIFGANRGQAVAFCEEMLRRRIDVPWEARARADHLDRELLELMGRAGCHRVLIGVESADAGVRRRNQKGMRDDIDMLEVVDDCAAARITPILSLILGLPGEDEGALRASLDLCARASLRAGVNLSLHLVNPQPGCGLGEEFGASSRPIEGIPPDMAFGAGETAPERALIAAHPDLFSTWSLLPQDEARLRDLHAIATALPEILMRFPRTFALIGARKRLDALDLYRDWRASERSFESFARVQRDPLIDDALRWEQALVRQAAGASLPRRAEIARGRRTRGPRTRGELLHLEHDLPAICAALRSARGALDVERKPTSLCVIARQRGVETLRISRDVARVLEALDELEGDESELEARMPEVASVLARLADAGLVELGPTANESNEPFTVSHAAVEEQHA
jgi:hypothetical protein